MSFNSESAEVLALKALGWLASNDELLPVFLGASGASIDTIRSAAADPAFLGAVLDFILMDDAWVLSFAQASNVKPEDIAPARMALTGGEQVHWT